MIDLRNNNEKSEESLFEIILMIYIGADLTVIKYKIFSEYVADENMISRVERKRMFKSLNMSKLIHKSNTLSSFLFTKLLRNGSLEGESLSIMSSLTLKNINTSYYA